MLQIAERMIQLRFVLESMGTHNRIKDDFDRWGGLNTFEITKSYLRINLK